MKRILSTWIVLSVAHFAGAADGTVKLNNYDANNPIFYYNSSTLLPVEGTFVQVLGGPLGGTLSVLSSSTGQTIFTLSEPGFFDAGFAVVPGAPENGAASFIVRAWRNAPDYITSTENGMSVAFGQGIGSNPPLPNLPMPAILQMPSFQVVVPEPSVVLLGLFGAALLLSLPKREAARVL